jgi:hypothetical protein
MAIARAMSSVAERVNVPAPMEEFSPQTINVTAHVNALFTLK